MEENKDIQQVAAGNQELPEEENKAAEAEKKPIIDIHEMLRNASKGKLTLEKAIRARGNDVVELKFDFMALSSIEIADAFDKDKRPANPNGTSNKQLMYLFAEAAAKATQDVDSMDIIQQISPVDAIAAMQAAHVFFTLSSRVAFKHYTPG